MDKIIGLENDSAERCYNRENIPPRKDEATFYHWLHRKVTHLIVTRMK